MKEDILKVDKSTYKHFISRYGTIKDPEIAKQLLCITTNAWYVLDDSLKQDSSVIMYYQPMGYGWDEVYDESNGVRELVDYIGAEQEDFIDLHGYFDLRLSKNVPEELKHDNLFLPDIKYPDDFDFITYCNIQKELKKEEKYIKNSGPGWVFGNYEPSLALKNIKFCYPSRYYANGMIEAPFVAEYDRTRLAEIVEKYTNQIKM